jgi:hypothetical protein
VEAFERALAGFEALKARAEAAATRQVMVLGLAASVDETG